MYVWSVKCEDCEKLVLESLLHQHQTVKKTTKYLVKPLATFHVIKLFLSCREQNYVWILKCLMSDENSGLFGNKALFTRNVCVCVCVKRQEWVPWQQVMVFILDICISKNATSKIKGKCKRRRYVWQLLKVFEVFESWLVRTKWEHTLWHILDSRLLYQCFVRVQVRHIQRYGCSAGHQEVSRCGTGAE